MLIGQINQDTVIQRADKLLFNSVDDETVILAFNTSKYFGLNTIGSKIWMFLESPITFKRLVHKLTTEYEVTEELCVYDTKTFLSKLMDKKLLIISDGQNNQVI